MRKLLVACSAVAATICGCSDDNGGAWIDSVVEDPSSLDQMTVEGETVHVDREEEVVYVEDCDMARAATAENGYAFICGD